MYLVATLMVVFASIQNVDGFSFQARVSKAMKPFSATTATSLNNAAGSNNSEKPTTGVEFGKQEDSYRSEMVRIAYERSLERMNAMDVFSSAATEEDNSSP